MLCGLCAVLAFQANVTAQTITNQPQGIIINNASSATFTVGASNATTYQWQLNGSNLTDVGNITGSTNSALTIENVTSNQAGSYTVIVNGSVTSTPPAVLTIVPGTIVTIHLVWIADQRARQQHNGADVLTMISRRRWQIFFIT